MGRFVNMTLLTIGVLVLINLAGWNLPASGFMYSIFQSVITEGGLTNIKASSFYGNLLLAITVTAGAVVVSFFTRTTPLEILKATFTLSLASLVVIDMIGIFQILASFDGWIKSIGFLIFIPFVIVYLLSAIDSITGGDN